jgi:hypothetical protein
LKRCGFGHWAALGAATFTTAVALIGPERVRVLPGCYFHAWTGLLCPGCGSTRALAAQTRGDLAAAIGFNPLTVLFLLALPGILVARRAGYRPPSFLVWSGVAMLGIFWVLRNLPLPVFEVLRP